MMCKCLQLVYEFGTKKMQKESNSAEGLSSSIFLKNVSGFYLYFIYAKSYLAYNSTETFHNAGYYYYEYTHEHLGPAAVSTCPPYKLEAVCMT